MSAEVCDETNLCALLARARAEVCRLPVSDARVSAALHLVTCALELDALAGEPESAGRAEEFLAWGRAVACTATYVRRSFQEDLRGVQ